MTREQETRQSASEIAPVYRDEWVTLYEADCRTVLPLLEAVDLVVTDPPYGDTSLEWDVPVEGFMPDLRRLSRQLWCFGSLRFFMRRRHDFDAWTYAQDIVWEKQNGSGFAADRFKRVHEHAVHWYSGAWGDLYNTPPQARVFGSAARVTVTRRAKNRVPHTGAINPRDYESDGERIERSVIYARSEHGRAIHRTQKPVGVTRKMIEHSCPPGGVVLDPFAGSCTTLVAARQAGRRSIGIELNLPAGAIDRIAQGVLDVA